MKSLQKFSLLIFVLLTTAVLNGQKKDGSAPYFFIQLTDPQFGFLKSNKSFTKETELYEKAVAIVNRLKPAFVVITGDFVNNRDDRTQVAEFKRISAMIDPGIPVWYCPGNHDIGQAPEAKDIELFIKDYGYDKFSFRLNNSTFIGLNTSLIKSGTPVYDKLQSEWLEKELSKAKGSEHIIVFCHYPFFINSYDEAENYSNISPESRNKYTALFKENKVDAIFAGHLHNNARAEYGNMLMVTTSAVGKQLGDAPSGLRIVKVYPNRLEDKYYGLDEVPAVVVLP